MREFVLICLIFLLAGCADFDFSIRPSILNSKKDGPDLPRYLGKHESVVVVRGTRSELLNAQRDALLILGCSDIREDVYTFRGDRSFVPGIVCGVGGETLYVTTEPMSGNRYSVSVVSYKRYPFPAGPRFLDEDFCDLLEQLLGRQDNANAN